MRNLRVYYYHNPNDASNLIYMIGWCCLNAQNDNFGYETFFYSVCVRCENGYWPLLNTHKNMRDDHIGGKIHVFINPFLMCSSVEIRSNSVDAKS